VGHGGHAGRVTLPSTNQRLSSVCAFTVIAKNLSGENKYVKSVTLNGRPVINGILRHADIVAGGELVFEMSKDRR